MTISKDAIQEIIKLETTTEVIKHVQSLGANSKLAVLPDGFGIHNLEKYQTHRDGFRASMSTFDIDEFVRYNVQYANKDKSQCFIDAEEMNASSIFDLGTTAEAGHCKHNANVTLKKTAIYKSLLAFNDSLKGQRDAAEWIEDHEDFIKVISDEGQQMTVANASSAIRNLTVRKESGKTSVDDNFAAQQSEFENVAMKTKDGLKMPAVILFTCKPFGGLEEREFELRHSIIDRNDKPMVTFRIKLLEAHEEDMAREFKEVLDEKLGDTIPTYIGSLQA